MRSSKKYAIINNCVMGYSDDRHDKKYLELSLSNCISTIAYV